MKEHDIVPYDKPLQDHVENDPVRSELFSGPTCSHHSSYPTTSTRRARKTRLPVTSSSESDTDDTLQRELWDEERGRRGPGTSRASHAPWVMRAIGKQASYARIDNAGSGSRRKKRSTLSSQRRGTYYEDGKIDASKIDGSRTTPAVNQNESESITVDASASADASAPPAPYITHRRRVGYAICGAVVVVIIGLVVAAGIVASNYNSHAQERDEATTSDLAVLASSILSSQLNLSDAVGESSSPTIMTAMAPMSTSSGIGMADVSTSTPLGSTSSDAFPSAITIYDPLRTIALAPGPVIFTSNNFATSTGPEQE